MDPETEEQTEEVVVEQETEEESAETSELDEDQETGAVDDSDKGGDESEVKPDEETEQEDDAEEDDSVVVSIGDEEPARDDDEINKAPQWVKDLRKEAKQIKKENRELKARLESSGDKNAASVRLGEKPTLESCDYDSEKFESDLTAWHDRKREADAQAKKSEEEQEQQSKAWQTTLETHNTKKAELKVPDYEEAEEAIHESLSLTQQVMIISGADNSALVFYALGRNPAKLKEISSIKDPVKYAFAVAKLETQLKVTKRKAATKPEKKAAGNGGGSSAVDSTLDKLRAEAAKTGDFTKVIAYKQKKRG